MLENTLLVNLLALIPSHNKIICYPRGGGVGVGAVTNRPRTHREHKAIIIGMPVVPAQSQAVGPSNSN